MIFHLALKRFPKYFVFFQNSIFRKKWALYEEMRARFRKKNSIFVLTWQN